MLCGNVSTDRHLRQFLLKHRIAKKNSAVKNVRGEKEGDGWATLAEHLSEKNEVGRGDQNRCSFGWFGNEARVDLFWRTKRRNNGARCFEL